MIENNNKLNILLIEDNPADVRLIKEIIKDFKIKNQLCVSTNGINAFKLLTQDDYKSLPDLILLDLSLPCKNGLELLNELKTDDKFKQIPIIILTELTDEDDVLNAYKLHANCFIRKPSTYNDYKRILQDIKNFWFKTVTLPNL